MLFDFVFRHLGFCTVVAFFVGAGILILVDLSRSAFGGDFDALTVHKGEIVEVDQ
ncbi:hypothetical protein SEA_DELIAN_47 [Gordonia phage Delian]|uniref:hypothetical protein n=1 Tax=Gordonia phage CaptainKirk2 TaxID=1887643 RepID=UPI00084F1A84|nr:hypothetical protein BIZ76_gp44 [Gordonia phage CaptainKirk2]AXH67469.1 hypothetical protein SEA_ZARBODNAMRA_43 [Gordonia phage Zarbodnamra]QBG78517.1 hypothetical protein SEA_BARCO_42 [Gordonia phage Barco]QDB74547.1 hypothetical protein SEA_MELBA_43 [Gordonia phage Melba]QDH85365.1 hypothetical protein SEA_MINTFEN_44 [Gordonia phage MintFen]QGH77967.1 hypothetical protein SEA_DELIAN_47 [Gordonia phage Delian]QKO02362.1 hypothetical protein SEA_BLINGBLING_41 [Gordonia phage BlingBling]QN